MTQAIFNIILAGCLAFSFECQAGILIGYGQAPEVLTSFHLDETGGSSNIRTTELAHLEAMARQQLPGLHEYGTNRTVKSAVLVDDPDLLQFQNAECFLVTDSSLMEPTGCKASMSLLAIEGMYLSLIDLTVQRLSEPERAKRRAIIMEILSEDEPELWGTRNPEFEVRWLERLIPSPNMNWSGDPIEFLRKTDSVFKNPNVREHILNAIRVGTTNAAPVLQLNKN